MFARSSFSLRSVIGSSSSGGIFAHTPTARFFGGLFGGSKEKKEEAWKQQQQQRAGRCADIFEHWEIAQGQRNTPGLKDPVCGALISGGAYVDGRVAWLPYNDAELARRKDVLGVPLRTSSLTAIEPIGAGVLLACIPLDLCVSPGFVQQTPALAKCFENVATEYSATVGESTFVLDHEAICSIVLLSFAVTTDGPLHDYFTVVMDVENTEARWQLTDITSACSIGDEADVVSAIGKEQPPLNEYMRQLAVSLPKENDTWAFFANLCSARTQAVRKLYEDVYGRKESVFYEGCSFEDFCSCAALYQSRSAPVPEKLQNAMQCKIGVIPFYDCADHKPSLQTGDAGYDETPEQKSHRQILIQQQQLLLQSGAVGEIGEPGDMLSLRFFKAAGSGADADSNEPISPAFSRTKTSGAEAPPFVPMSCRIKPSIGVFAAQDIEAGQPITRCFNTAESRREPSEVNLSWLINHSCVPWDCGSCSSCNSVGKSKK